MRWMTTVLLIFVCCLAARQAGAVEPRESGLNELVIFKPGTHERGLPAVIIDDGEVEGTQVVDIPPTVHVHRFYYSGDKEYQGPIVQGGPTVVVATNPFSGERQHINVVLPSGAPVIAYNKGGITYVYPKRRVRIKFSRLHRDKAIVQYHSGRGVGRHAFDKLHHAKEHTHTAFHKSHLWQSLIETGHDTGGMLVGAKGTVDSLAGGLLDRVKAATHVVPGVTALKGYAQEGPQRIYDNVKRVAQRQKDDAQLDFLPTNR